MSTPQIYLVEPYNAYTAQQGGRKKHWHEIVEEQALMERIIAEQLAAQQAQIALQEAQSKTLPPNSPHTSVATVGNATGVAGGAGGVPEYFYFHPELDVVAFTATPTSGNGPLTVVFTNLTSTPELDTYLWKFGDGTTSTDASPTHVYDTGSAAGYTVQLTASHDLGSPIMSSSVGYISASIPSVTAAFTFVTTSVISPFTATFTNTTNNTSQTPTTTYLWLFKNNTTTSSSLVNPSVTISSGSFTASLQATGSYTIASLYTQSFYATPPSVTATFTFTTSSNTSGSVATFVNKSTASINTSTDSVSYLWSFGSGSLTSTAVTPGPITYTVIGPYTASLAMSESVYGKSSFVTHSWRLS